MIAGNTNTRVFYTIANYG